MEEEMDETIHVTESVYKAAESLDSAVAGDGFNVAAVIRDYYRHARKKKKAAFWKEVYDYLMTKECVGKGTLTVVFPDGEEMRRVWITARPPGMRRRKSD